MKFFCSTSPTPRAQYLPEGNQGWFDVYVRALTGAFARAWRWRFLWLWGFLLPAGSGFSTRFGGNESLQRNDHAFAYFVAAHAVWIILGITVVALIAIIFWILGNVARWGLIETLSEIQDRTTPHAEKVSLVWRRGVHGVWRMFLLDFFVIALILALLLCAVLLGVSLSFVEMTPGIIALLVLFGMLAIVVLVAFFVALRYTVAVAAVIMALTDGRPIRSLRMAWNMVRHNLREVVKLMIVRILVGMIGIGVAFAAAFVLLVVGGILFGLGAVIGGGFHFADSVVFLVSTVAIGFVFGLVVIGAWVFYRMIFALVLQDLWVWWVKRMSPALRATSRDVHNKKSMI